MLNDAFLAFHKSSREALIGKSSIEVHGKVVFESLIKPHLDAVLEGQKRSFEGWVAHAHDAKRYLSIKFSPYRQNLTSSKIDGIIKTTRDMTEEKLLQEENERQEKLLVEQGKLAAMGEMIGAIAHQWRQPLSELSLNIQNLKYFYKDQKIDEAFIAEYIGKNKETINFMSKTIDDFRNFFRIDKTKVSIETTHAIEAVLALLNKQLAYHNIQVNIVGESFTLQGYESEFKQALMNIINNAKDALIADEVDNPCINITLHERSITLQDNAKGIEPKVLSRIFEPYFSTKEEGKGMGMGLYITKMIIENNMHGTITVRSDHQGTSFRLRFA